MFINDIIEFIFLRNAFYAALLSGICCGIIGTVIVEKKLVIMSGGIAHAAFGGVGLGYFLKSYFLNIEPIIGALVFSTASSIGIVHINKKSKTYSDVIIAVFWSLGMALGIVFISLLDGYPPDMTSYLFGDILTVSNTDLLVILILNAVILFVTVGYYNYIKAYIFDSKYIEILGIKSIYIEYLIFILISFSTVILIRIVGIILILSLLTVPAAVVRQYTNKLYNIMIYSVILASIVGITGLWISYKINIPSGASIIILSSIIYFTSSIPRSNKYI